MQTGADTGEVSFSLNFGSLFSIHLVSYRLTAFFFYVNTIFFALAK